jgi:iron complex outermembrane receptor protein
MKPDRFALRPLAAALACILGGQPALAQTVPEPAPAVDDAGGAAAPRTGKQELRTVVVTAQRHAQSLQKTAISIVALDGAELAEQGVSNTAEALKNITNVEVQGAARGNVIAMRGLGSDLPPGMGESAVSTNFDGVYNFRAEGTTAGLFDLDRIEVLRGPQGTLYGRSAAGGVVNFLTRDPEIGKLGGNASLEFGSYGLVRTEGGANLPLSDKLAVRISGTSIDRKGYLTDGFNDDVSSAGRVKVLFKPTSKLSLLAGMERVRLEGKGPGFIAQANWLDEDKRLEAVSGPGTEVGYQRYVQSKRWLEANLDLGFGVLTVIPAWQRADGEVYRKLDSSRAAGSEEQHNLDPQDARQDSLEVRLASGARAPVQWVAGYYGYKMSSGALCLINCAPADFAPNPNIGATDSKALFGQATVPLTAQLRATAGVRSTRDDKRASSVTGTDMADRWKHTDGKLGIEFDLARDAMVYATYATSYRPGGFNGLPMAVQPLRFESEELKSTELGIKSRLFGNTLQVNADVFNLDYRNYQIVDFSPPTYSRISNVPKQTIRGLEVDSRMLLGRFGALRASVALLDARLGQFTPYGTSTSIEGQALPHAPKRTFKAGYEFPIDLGSGAELALRADARYVSEQYVSATENANTLQESHATGDLSAIYRSADGHWSVTAYVRNVNDYVAKTANFAGFTMVSAPRTAGVILGTKF